MTTTELHALRAVIRHWHDSLVAEAQRPIDDMREWTDTDWADSGWTSAEADAIRRALTEDTPDPGTDGELMAARDTLTDTAPVCPMCGLGPEVHGPAGDGTNDPCPPVCATCHNERRIYQVASDMDIPCPDCTEDTPDE